MKLFIPLSLLMISFFGTAQNSSKEKFKLDRNKIAILKSQDRKNVRLGAKDFILIEKLLQECVGAHNSRLDSASYQFLYLKNNRRQYIAYSDNNQKMVWVNCFCDNNSKLVNNWKKKPIVVYDGGSCFFNLLINLSKQECEDLWVNGIAYRRSVKKE